ncbi:MAG: hypothetical protein JW876_09905 [Candidatus Krumholzibacteriota bacterium]|nr:hypothetical protein [Candidatus Krumholzibacteriota bacterium]
MRWRFRPIDSPVDYAGPASYKVRFIIGDEVATIQRFLRKDPSGILQIGVTKNAKKRRRQFVRGLATGWGHSEANLLHMLERRSCLRRRFSGARYEIAFKPFATREEAEAEEETLIKRYLFRFGEVPPLNSAIPKKYK